MNNKFDDPSTINNLTQWMIFRRDPLHSIFTNISASIREGSPSLVPSIDVNDLSIIQGDKNDRPTLSFDDNPRTPINSVPTNDRTSYRSSPTLGTSSDVLAISSIMDDTYIKPKHNLYIPNRPNTLFWALYIAYYGESTYLAIGNKYGNVEIAEKQKIMEFLKPNKKLLKTINKKITIGTTQEIMSDLMTNMKTSLLTVIAYAAYYKRNILLLNTINKTYIKHMYSTARTPEFGTSVGVRGLSGDGLSSQDKDMTTPWIVIQYTDSKKYGVLLGDDIFDTSPFIEDKYIHIETYDKPLKGISTYKMNELVEIASKIPEMPNADNPKKVKSELYGKIWQHCLWI